MVSVCSILPSLVNKHAYTNKIVVLNTLPSSFTQYHCLMKLGEYFYAIYHNENLKCEQVQYTKFEDGFNDIKILRSKDLRVWEEFYGGPQITYDPKTQKFYGVILSKVTDTGANVYTYDCVIIDPITFEYTKNTIFNGPLTNYTLGSSNIIRYKNTFNIIAYGYGNRLLHFSSPDGINWDQSQIIYEMKDSNNKIYMKKRVPKLLSTDRFMAINCFLDITDTDDETIINRGTNYRYTQTNGEFLPENTDYFNNYQRDMFNTTSNVYNISSEIQSTNNLRTYTNITDTSNRIIDINPHIIFYDDYILAFKDQIKISNVYTNLGYIQKYLIYKTDDNTQYELNTSCGYVAADGKPFAIRTVGFLNDYLYYTYADKDKITYFLARIHISYLLKYMIGIA